MQDAVAPQQVRTSATPVVADHRVYAFFTHRQPRGAQVGVRIGDLPCGASPAAEEADSEKKLEEPARVWLPERIFPALRGRYSKEAIWEEVTAPRSDSLFPHIQSIVTGQNPDFLRRYKLTNRALDLLAKADLYDKDTPREERRSHELILHLPKPAAARLSKAGLETKAVTNSGNAHDLRLRIERAELFHFRTGVVVTMATLEVQGLDKGGQIAAAELQEAVYAIARFPCLHWRVARGPDSGAIVNIEPFSLADVIRSLAQGGEAQTRKSRRTFTHTFLRFDDPLEEEVHRGLGTRLARHYTDDYAIADNMADLVRVQDFATVSHWLSREGACSIVRPGELSSMPDFLKDFRQATLEENYLPIAILNLHELAEALDISNASACWPSAAALEKSTLTQLAVVRDRALCLRLAYRFRQVSTVTMHNSINAGFRRVLGLDAIERELTSDVGEINEYLQAAHHHSLEHLFRWPTSLAAAALATLLIFGFFTQVEKAITYDPAKASKLDDKLFEFFTLFGIHGYWWIALAAGLIVFGGVLWMNLVIGGAHGSHLKHEAEAKVRLKSNE